jgi:hypothetical protein
MSLILPVLQPLAGNTPLIYGNSKLKKSEKYSIIGYGIPADFDYVDENGDKRNTCEKALACRAVCYAKQGSYRYPNVKQHRHRSLQHAMSATFVQDTVNALSEEKKYNVVRVNDSGDFLSQNNLDNWKEIARRMPEKIFYAYTKRLDLDLWSNLPSNLRITQSFGGKLDYMIDMDKPHSRIFSSVEAREAAGYVDGNINDEPAIEGTLKIGLVYHGGRNLTPAQKVYFAKGDN